MHFEPIKQFFHNLLMISIIAGTIGCQGIQKKELPLTAAEPLAGQSETDVQVVRLGQADKQAFKKIQRDFSSRNPGYQIDFLKGVKKVASSDLKRVLFVQEGQPEITLSTGLSSEVTVGDILMLSPGVSLEADSALSLLQFIVPSAFPSEVPSIIRPDWDPNITDVPGGCATETNAYRRILLTWKKEVGEYLYHDLNAHRVRIMDSFSHYHPVDGGFDEFYLVQMALPDARIITSNDVDLITNPSKVTRDQASKLLHTTSLKVGDLVYLPRGVMHRGVGGVLAQVITIPGFIPGSEIGVDHYLKAINESLNLDKDHALPFHADGADSPIVK